MILAALTVCLIEKHYRHAATWALAASIISATGLMHGYTITQGAITNSYGPANTWPFIIGYAGIAVILFGLDLLKTGPAATK